MKWWAVMLEGESPEVYGPFRSLSAAQDVADRWNGRHGAEDDRAYVVPIRPCTEIA